MTATPKQEELAAQFGQATIIPVLTIERLEDAVPLAKALVAGGVRTLEITLRTPVAIESAKAIMAHVPEAVVGIGTILNADDLARAEGIGARFGISPGATPDLLKAAAASALPFAPGIATASELMLGLSTTSIWSNSSRPSSPAVSRRFVLWRDLFRMCGSVQPAVLARPTRLRGWPSPTWSRWAVPGYARQRISGPATGPA